MMTHYRGHVVTYQSSPKVKSSGAFTPDAAGASRFKVKLAIGASGGARLMWRANQSGTQFWVHDQFKG